MIRKRMRVTVIDDEALAIEEIKYFLREYEVDIISSYMDPQNALDHILTDRPDMVFMDMEMPTMNGIELALKIREILDQVIIIFITAYSQYAIDSFTAHPLDYLLKPISGTAFNHTMQYARRQFELINREQDANQEESIFATDYMLCCFGKFEMVNHNKQIIKFPTRKARELLSYMICKEGTQIYRDEIVAALFGEAEMSNALNNYYVTLYRLRNIIAGLGLGRDKVLIKGNCSIQVADGVCDFIDFMRFTKGNKVVDEASVHQAEKFIELYTGELFSDIDREWTNEARVWLEIQMEELIYKTALYYRKLTMFREAEKLLQKLIEINSQSVNGYETLMDLYIDMNNKDAYRITYKKYLKLMKEEDYPDINPEYGKCILLKM